MLFETLPNIKLEKLTGVTANLSFTLPANHAIQNVYVTNSGASGAALEIKNGSSTLLSFQAGGLDWRVFSPEDAGVNVMYSSAQTLDLVNTGSWTNVNVDLYVVLIQLEN